METAQQTSVRPLATVPNWLWSVIILVALIALRFILSDFQLKIVSEMLIAGLFALSLNLILGYGGMVHFGHAAFYGIGAYTVGVTMARLSWSPWVAMAVAPFVSGLAALVIGWFVVRRVGLYFSILTLAFGQLVYTLLFNAREITGGDDGLHGLIFPEIISDQRNYYLFTLAIFVICYLVIQRIVHSPFILVLRAVRENAERAQFIGVDVRRHQLVTFVLGGFFAGVAGALMVGEQHFVGIEMLFWTTSAEPILASLLGGIFILQGPVFGASLLVFLHLTLTRVLAYWPLVLGTLTVVIVLVAPTGLLGLARRLLRMEEGRA